MAGWFGGDTIEAPPVTGWWAELIVNHAGGIASAGAFGDARVATRQLVTPSGIATAEVIGTVGLRYRQTVAPAGITSGEAFGGSATQPGAVNLGPQQIPSAEAVGAPAATPGPVQVLVAGVASGQAFGAATVSTGPVDVAPTAIGSGEAFGGLRTAHVVAPTGIVSEDSLSVAGVTSSYTILAAGVAGVEAFGNALVMGPQQPIGPSGIASAEAFGGSMTQPGPVTVLPMGVGSGEAVTAPTITVGPVTVAPAGIASGEAFGSARTAANVAPVGIPSAESVGAASVTGIVAPTGIGSAEAFGDTTVVPPASTQPIYRGVGTSTAAGSYASGSSHTIDVVAGDYVYTFVAAAAEIASLTFDGVAMTFRDTLYANNDSGFGFAKLSVYRSIAQTSGTKTVSLTLAGTNYHSVQSFAFYGVGGDWMPGKTAGTGTTPTQSQVVPAGSLGLQAFTVAAANGGISATSGGVNLWNSGSIPANATLSVSGSYSSDTYTVTQFSPQKWAGMGLVLVPVGAPIPGKVDYIGVSNAAGQSTGSTSTANTTVTPTLPVGTMPGDRVYIVAGYSGAANALSSDWIRVPSTDANGVIIGSGSFAAGAGTRYCYVWYRDYDGVWTMPAVTQTNVSLPSLWVAAISLRRNSLEAAWSAPTYVKADDFGTANTAHQVTLPSMMTHDRGLLIAATVTNDNVTASTVTLTQTGATLANLTERADGGTATGNDVSGKVHTAEVTTGATNTLAFALTLSAASQGGTVLIEQTCS